MKPTLRLLFPRINEITKEVEITNYHWNNYTWKYNKFVEYVNKDEHARDGTIDIFLRVVNEKHELLFEFENNIVSELIVFKTFAVNGSDERNRRFFIKITEGAIEDYKSV